MKKRPELKDLILKHRSNGLSYNQIASLLKCSTGSITYHLDSNQKEKSKIRKRIHDIKVHPYKIKLSRFLKEIIFKEIKIGSAGYKKYISLKILKFSYDKKNKMQKEPLFTFEDVLKKFGENPTCYLTGEKIDIYKPKTYQFDHIIPRSKGGDSSIENLGICTKNANMAKTDMMLDEFISLCEKVVKIHSKNIIP